AAAPSPIRLPAGIGVSNAVDTAHEVVLIVLTARRTNPKRAWTIQPRATALTRRDRGRAHSRPGRHRNNPPAPHLPCPHLPSQARHASSAAHAGGGRPATSFGRGQTGCPAPPLCPAPRHAPGQLI